MYHLEEDALDQDRIFKQPVCNEAITPGCTWCTFDPSFSWVYDSFSRKKWLPNFISVEQTWIIIVNWNNSLSL